MTGAGGLSAELDGSVKRDGQSGARASMKHRREHYRHGHGHA